MKPLTIEIRSNITKKDKYENVLNRVKEIKEKRDAVLLDYNSISEEDIGRLEKIIPNELNSVNLANDLSSLGSKYGIILVDYKVEESASNGRDEIIVEKTEQYKTTKISYKFRGLYNDFVAFLSELESGLNLIDVIGLNIKQGSGDSSLNKPLEYALEINTYSLK